MSPISSDLQCLPIRMRHRSQRALVQRPQHELFLLMDGVGEQRLADGRRWRLHGGDLACFPAGVTHIGDARPHERCQAWLCFWPPRLHRSLPAALRRRIQTMLAEGPWHRPVDPVVRDALQNALRQLSNPDGTALLEEQLRLTLLHQILIHALRAASSPGQAPTDDVPQVLTRIAGHLEEEWPVARAAAATGLRRSRFLQRCRELVGRGFTDWLIDQRVIRAVTLLQDGRLTPDEVAASCGFASRSTFFRHMRLRSGRSPAAWLRSIERSKSE
ncbi:MAG: helix-turn-helix domain-containing protein [Planctomycetota bacterium]